MELSTAENDWPEWPVLAEGNSQAFHDRGGDETAGTPCPVGDKGKRTLSLCLHNRPIIAPESHVGRGASRWVQTVILARRWGGSLREDRGNCFRASEAYASMSDIGSLLCGDESAEGIAKTALDQLSHSIANFSSRAVRFLNEDVSDDALAFGPFCARVLLENACAALVGRLDSFRMLYLCEFQAQPEYEHGKRARSAFSWFGDVIPEEKPTQPLWQLDVDFPKISRALFSRHCDHVYWKPAIERMLDFLSPHASNSALADILSLEAESYINFIRGKSSQLYSTLSKGVHWEFFTSALVFDEATVKSSIRETCLLVSQLGLTSHFIPTAYASLRPQQALETYLAFRKDIP